MANAKFTISSSASVNRGYDATHSEVMALQLEDQPSPDVVKCQYTIGRATVGAPTPTFSTALGIASPPNGIVELTMPGSGVHLYEVQCTVNNGVDSNSTKRPDYTFSRMVAIRSDNGFRKIMAAETTEYDPAEGWASAFNDVAEFITLIPPLVSAIAGTLPIVVNSADPQNPVVSINAATTSLPGSMSAADKTKLNTLRPAAPTAPITFTDLFGTDAIGINPASGAAAGSMSAADKTKLDAATDLSTVSTIVMRDVARNINASKITAPVWYSEATPMTIGMDGVGVNFFTFTDEPKIDAGYDVEAPGFVSNAHKLLSAQTVSRALPLHWQAGIDGSNNPTWIVASGGDVYNAVAVPEAELYSDCNFTNGMKINSITLRHKGAGTGANPLPVEPPTFGLYRKVVSTGVAIAVATQTAVLDGTFRGTWRDLTLDLTGAPHTVDTTNARYYLMITSEHDTDAIPGDMIRGVTGVFEYPANFVIGMV